MLNLIKSDFYRLMRSKGFYITVIVEILITLAFFYLLTADISSSGTVKIEQTSGGLIQSLKGTMSGMGSATTQISYFAISLFVILVGHEFSMQTFKNSLTSGISKTSFVLGKYVTTLLAFMLIAATMFVTYFLAGMMKFGSGDTNIPKLLGEMVFMTIGNGLILSILFAIAMLILVVTHSSVAAIAFAIIYPAVIPTVLFVVKVDVLKYLSFLSYGWQLDELSKDSLPYLIIGLVVIVVSLVSSSLILKKKVG
ncbi:hypothetical protein Hs30E_19680 [Lactococcus hodotermopsidis]|uniref:ABC transporter permease n=1 Tax=Pseudolactococcus hodotermopsidis TaxID=2709157 RepID=A0A6A0BI33_9LACT|nr:ABC transporter permease [Lactococcus hodotermopsidis]GFH43417.1 hypothetical protein Hs30E_19680 [Lactococcus hodotermopsidis]